MNNVSLKSDFPSASEQILKLCQSDLTSSLFSALIDSCPSESCLVIACALRKKAEIMHANGVDARVIARIERIGNALFNKYRNNRAVENRVSCNYIADDGFMTFGENDFFSEKKRFLVFKETLMASDKFFKKNHLFNPVSASAILCGTIAVPSRAAIGFGTTIFKATNKESSHSWNPSHIVHCKRVWLCPECRRYIFSARSLEIAHAFKKWHDEGGKCYMLTLTVQHRSSSDLCVLVSNIKKAWQSFRHTKVFSRFVKACPGVSGGVSLIQNFEFTFGVGSGVHPHKHVLFFCKGDALSFSSDLKTAWCESCARCSLKALPQAIDFCEIDNSGSYLSKIGFELTDSSFKKESNVLFRSSPHQDGSDFVRALYESKRYNYMGLCEQVALGQDWAFKQVLAYYQATYQLRALAWSHGLKDYFKIADVSDSDAFNKGVEVVRKGYISRQSFDSLSCDKIAFLTFLDGGQAMHKDFLAFCFAHSIDVYNTDGKIIINGGCDSEKVQALVRDDIRSDNAQLADSGSDQTPDEIADE